MSWFRTAGICESYSLENFSRELYLLSATEPRPDRLPVDTEYLREKNKAGIIQAIVKAVKRGIAASAIMAALAAAGFTGAYWASVVDKVESEVKSQRAVTPSAFGDEEFRTLEIPQGAPAPAAPTVDQVNLGIAEYVSRNEGSEGRVYDDGAGNLTIGIGHLIEPGDRELFRNLFGNAVDYDELIAGRETLTPAQRTQLFAADLEEHIDRARRLVNNFDAYPQEVKEAIVDGIYRGDLGPRTRGLMNAGRWGEVADEYLNHGGYRRSRAALDERASYPAGDPRRNRSIPNAGIAPRMERNAERFRAYAESLRQVR